MCIEDYRLAQFITTNIFSFVIGGSGPSGVNKSRQRVGLTITLGGSVALSTAVVEVRCNDITVAQLNSTVPWRHVTINTNGNLPMQKFTVHAVTGTPTVTFIEYILPERYLSTLPDGFESKYNPQKV